MLQQTILSQMSLPDGYTFDSYYMSKANEECLYTLYPLDQEQEHRQLVIWGEANAGKSHLLQAACHRFYSAGYRASYYPLKSLFHYGPDMLKGNESSRLLAIDDLDVIVQSDDWEFALFDLINRCRMSGQILLFSATENPRQLKWNLPDLASRLIWGLSYPLYSLTDEEKSEALQYRANQRGFQIPVQVVDYIQKRYPRDFDSLLNLLDRLDKASLSQQQSKITIPFVKRVLQEELKE